MNILKQFEKHLENAHKPKSIVGMNKFQRIMALQEWGKVRFFGIQSSNPHTAKKKI